jgi:hypothetical protein
MAETYPNVLLVEGKQDVRVIPELIESNGVNWGTRKNPVVHIRDFDGYQNLVAPDVISTELQGSGLSALGIMVDADEYPLGRWQSLRAASLESIPDLPETLPEVGLIHLAPNGVRFGVWMMPDNRMRGMLETFLACLVPEDGDMLLQFAREAAQAAKDKGATFTEVQLDKVEIYTWLAWRNPPGRQLHQAIRERILDPRHPQAQGFVAWFKALYGLS